MYSAVQGVRKSSTTVDRSIHTRDVGGATDSDAVAARGVGGDAVGDLVVVVCLSDGGAGVFGTCRRPYMPGNLQRSGGNIRDWLIVLRAFD